MPAKLRYRSFAVVVPSSTRPPDSVSAVATETASVFAISTAAGVGAVHAWQGNKNVGEGRMTITESKPAERITIRLEFIKPFAATNTTVFTFVEQGGQTVVRWSMTGRNNFMGKLFGLLMNMDKMVGGDFEKGLASMKAVAEAAK